MTEILAAEFGDPELLFARDFPQKGNVDLFSETVCAGDHFSSRRRLELQQHVPRAHLGALARRRLDLIGLSLLAQYRANLEIAGLFEKQVH